VLEAGGEDYLRIQPTRLRFENGTEPISVLATTTSGLSRDAETARRFPLSEFG
jgi:hypothetical protein